MADWPEAGFDVIQKMGVWGRTAVAVRREEQKQGGTILTGG